jgi:hypothetical protein
MVDATAAPGPGGFGFIGRDDGEKARKSAMKWRSMIRSNNPNPIGSHATSANLATAFCFETPFSQAWPCRAQCRRAGATFIFIG